MGESNRSPQGGYAVVEVILRRILNQERSYLSHWWRHLCTITTVVIVGISDSSEDAIEDVVCNQRSDIGLRGEKIVN